MTKHLQYHEKSNSRGNQNEQQVDPLSQLKAENSMPEFENKSSQVEPPKRHVKPNKENFVMDIKS